MQNIFVVHTPFHVYISEMMVGTLAEFAKCKNVLLLEFIQPIEHISRKLWSKVIFLENVGNSTLGHNRYVMCENNMGLVLKLVFEDPKSCLFLSDICWPMNNRLFFSRQLRRKVTFCLFSDGLGTYVFPRVTKMLFLRGLIKYLNGLIGGGVKYRNYLGSQFGVDRKEIIYIYAPNVELVDCDISKKKEILTGFKKKLHFNQSKCILIDIPGWRLVSENDWRIIRANTVGFLKSLGADLYYKNHPSGRQEEEVYYRSQGFNIIEHKGCAEQFIAEKNFGIVVSYVSSTLFNLKSMYQDSIRCIAISHKILNTKRTDYNENKFDKVYELFRKVNAEVVDI